MLLGYLGKEHLTFTQTAAGDFIKAIITISANASQNEQSCIGPNSLTRQLVSETCSASLITEMLRGGNPLTVGVGIIIEVIRKNNSDYDPDVGAGRDLPPSSSDPIYLGTLLRHFSKHIPEFIELLLSPNHTVMNGDSTMTIKRKDLQVAFGASIEPLGFDRFKTCELMAELLHCSNMSLLNEPGSEAYVKKRDQEREQLKAAGALPSIIQEPQSAVTDFSEGSVTFQNEQSYGSDQAEELNKSDLVNSAEDDGFEDVGTSSDLADDMNNEFDEKAAFELEGDEVQNTTPTKTTKPRIDLDEEFFDEPLTSPRLEAVDEKDTELFEHPETVENSDISPSSPPKALTSDIKHLDISKETREQESERPAPVTYESPETISETPHVNPSQTPSNAAPPLPERRSLNTAVESHEPGSPAGISPHPDDKPAPLFFGKVASPTKETTQETTETSTNDQAASENDDTTMGQNGESVLIGHDQATTPQLETDEDGQPIVGDYLKMMFVEHKVVPTILVSS